MLTQPAHVFEYRIRRSTLKHMIPRWYDVAKDIALIQPSSAFMDRVISIHHACRDERQESSFSDRIAASALPRGETKD